MLQGYRSGGEKNLNRHEFETKCETSISLFVCSSNGADNQFLPNLFVGYILKRKKKKKEKKDGEKESRKREKQYQIF